MTADSTPLVRASSPNGPEAQAYDFDHPRAFSDRHLRTAADVHDALARLLARALSDALGETVGVQRTALHEVLAVDFGRSRSSPTALFGLDAGGAGASAGMALDLAPSLALFLVERHLGSPDAIGAPSRGLSDFERAVVERRWLPVILGALGEAWQSAPPRPTSFTADAARLPVAPPDEAVVVVDLEVSAGEGTAPFSLAYPADTLRRLLGLGGGVGSSGGAIDGLPLLVRAELGRTRLRVGELTALAPGDVIPLASVPGAPVPVWLGARLRFDAHAGVRGARLAVQALTPPAPPSDDH